MMKIWGKTAASLLGSAALLFLGPGVAGAASVSYYLDQTNISQLPDGTNYLQVTISDSAYLSDPNAIRFDVTLLAPLTSIADGNFGIDTFGFNTLLTPATVQAAISGLPTGWTAAINSNQDGFGNFELVNNGSGTTRQNPTLTFYISGISGDALLDYVALSSGNAGQGNQYFASHVAGFLDQEPLPSCPSGGSDPCTVTSAFFGGSTAVVPVPAAAWLFCSALGVLGAARRRTK